MSSQPSLSRPMSTAHRTSGRMSRETRLKQRARTSSKAKHAMKQPHPPPYSLKTSQKSAESPVHRARHDCDMTSLSPSQASPPPSLRISTARNARSRIQCKSVTMTCRKWMKRTTDPALIPRISIHEHGQCARSSVRLERGNGYLRRHYDDTDWLLAPRGNCTRWM